MPLQGGEQAHQHPHGEVGGPPVVVRVLDFHHHCTAPGNPHPFPKTFYQEVEQGARRQGVQEKVGSEDGVVGVVLGGEWLASPPPPFLPQL